MNGFIRFWSSGAIATALVGVLSPCTVFAGGGAGPEQELPLAIPDQIRAIQQQYAPDTRLAIFNVGLQSSGRELVLTGEVDRAEARVELVRTLEGTGASITDRIRVLPDASLGEELYGISCLSVASARLQPEHKAEMGSQVLLGHVVRLWKRSANPVYAWYLAQADDNYLSWLQKGTFVGCTREQAEAWKSSPLLIVTVLEDCILEQPRPDAQPVSDVVICDLVRKTGEVGGWYKVELPDGRSGFLRKRSAQDYERWKQERQPTARNIERTARRFIGRPYLWGGNSPKGFDCSGFTQTVFFLNGIGLQRDSSKQAEQGVAVPLDAELSRLKQGDLLFFGLPGHRGGPERVVHVGIYLSDKLFIHSSERVKISSLDPQSPARDENRIRTLLRARRLLPDA